METMTPKSCAAAACGAVLCERPTQIRRGDRVADYVRGIWRCDACEGVDGERPYEFVDAVLGRRNDGAARAAWVAKFGEELPPARPPGPKPEVPRTERLTVLLTPGELAEIDRARGAATRSDFVRAQLLPARGAGTPRTSGNRRAP
jgi:hypothetical protein